MKLVDITCRRRRLGRGDLADRGDLVSAGVVLEPDEHDADDNSSLQAVAPSDPITEALDRARTMWISGRDVSSLASRPASI